MSECSQGGDEGSGELKREEARRINGRGCRGLNNGKRRWVCLGACHDQNEKWPTAAPDEGDVMCGGCLVR